MLYEYFVDQQDFAQAYIIMQLTILLSLGLGLLPPIFAELITTAFKHIQQDKVCGSTQLSGLEGIISSPNYPHVYPNHTSCTWVIISPAKSKLTISVTDFDVEEDSNCNHPPCCQHTWLSIPKGGGRKGSQQYCGSKTLVAPVSVYQNVTFVKFHTSKVIKGGRGFRLKYTISEDPPASVEGPPCGSGAEHCPRGFECATVDGVFVCVTGRKCPSPNGTPCGLTDGGCFDNVTQRCDGVQDCATGADEADCASRNCYSDELMCRSGNGCYKMHQKCDMKMDCSDFSDEINCGLCADGLVLCSPVDRRCFSPNLERCNGKFDCLFGEDEVGCVKGCPEDEITCTNGEGCYSPLQRCDSVRNCRDDSDETNCPSCSATINRFACDNGRCIAGRLWCNGADDCGDGSDEEGCVKTSVVTVAIVGSLTCGLLLVVAAGCVCRLYGGRVTPVVLPRVEERFFHGEPPPAYTPTPVDYRPLQPASAPSRRPRASRRQRRPHRPPPARTTPDSVRETSLEAQRSKCEAVVDMTGVCASSVPDGSVSPLSTSTLSSLESPGRESGTSSTSLLSYQSGNDDTELLIL